MRALVFLILGWCLFLTAGGLDPSGTWKGGEGEGAHLLILEQSAEGRIDGSFHSLQHHGVLTGRLATETLVVDIDFGGGVVFTGSLRIEADAITGKIYSEALKMEQVVDLRRSEVAGLAALGLEPVDLGLERPEHVYRNALPEKLASAVIQRIERHVEENSIVGLATGIIYDGEIADLRTYGWEDFSRRQPVTDETMFRWASIAKPLTALAAMQLVEQGKLDPDRDIRELVPEFPEKPWPVTTRQLLRHQAGMVHYQPGKVIVTERDYDVPHPFSDRVLALDKFKESALLFAPGASFSYSTPGYALLGAVIERAGEQRYEDRVRNAILAPLGMASMQPDYPHVTIAHRTRGYKALPGGYRIDSGDSDVSWKLAAGGWISTIGDLTRFAEGIIEGELVSTQTREAMWTGRAAEDGTGAGYGDGFNIGDLDGRGLVWHSGAQRKTQTLMMLCPEAGLGVTIMSNTEGPRHERFAEDVLALLLGEHGDRPAHP